jgi:GMP synthase (glutamine-hydrolysing)
MRTADGVRQYEVGWRPIRFSKNDLLRQLPSEAVVLHWHGDTFDLPEQAERLASSDLCANQGFRLGTRLFGLQFHAETSADDVENFLHVDAQFLVRANGENAATQLREGTAKHMPRFREVSDQLLRTILAAMTR